MDKKKRKKGKKLLVILVVILVAAVAGYWFWSNKKKEAAARNTGSVQTATVTRMDISSELTASSSLSPKDTYEVTSLVEGEVLEALFEEGDVVEKGQILYRIDASSMDTDLSSAQTTLKRAQESEQTAKEDYEEALQKLSGNTYKSTGTGYIKTLYVEAGDKISNGTKIADLYDDSVMKLTVPFLTAEAEQITVGSEAVLTIEDTGEQIPGTVISVSSLEEVLSGGRLVKAVTVETQNPGGLTSLMQATVKVGDFVCSSEGTFVPKTERTMTAELSGNVSLEVASVITDEGSYVGKGTAMFAVTAKSAEKYIKTFKDSYESAGDSVENAENKLSNTQDTIDDYTITAPISGTVITKNSKVGDKISRNSGSSTVMAVIYDLSAMTLEMSVDELDVRSVKVGQTVEITADAVEGVTFGGTVTNVSLQGSYSNGVTNYPVTVTMEETGDLLPGMNVDAQIILDESKDALCIPVGALMRGNRVYVKSGSSAGTAGGNQENAAAGGSQENAAAGTAQVKKSGVPDGFVAVEVTTGIVNDDYVEILSGLSEGDEVYVDPSAGQTTTNMWQMGGPGMQGGMPGMAPGGGSNNRGGSGNMGGGAPRP